MNPSQLSFAPILPLWLILLLFAAGAGACVFQFRRLQRRLFWRKALLISLLRLGAFALLAVVALNPFWTERKEIKIAPALAILLDASPSMGLPGHPGKSTRLEEAKEALLGGPDPVLKILEEKYEVRFFELGESLKGFSSGDLSQLKAGTQRGDLNEALEALAGKNQFALLLSDGNSKWEEKKGGAPPVLVYPLGSRDEYRDILIKSVKAPPVAFRGKEVVVDAAVKGYGYDGLQVPVILKSGEKLLATKSVRLQSGTGEAAVGISFIPEEIGSYTLSLTVPPQVGETLAGNNRRDFSLKVVRDKIRVLMVSGSPSMNYRFLRAALKNDPAIDLLSFVILRTPANILNVPVQEQSLIPFPVETLFTKDLKNFDLLIFDNFLYHPFFRAQYLGNIRDFVREGGAFAFIGGAGFLGEGGYGGTPLEEILPTRWIGRESYRRPASLTVRPSRAGASHPITFFSADEAAQKTLWQEMPPLSGFNPLESKNTGTVLLEGAEGGFWPILTIGAHGKGRTLVLATDDSWKWYMGMVAREKDHSAYLRLVERMVCWLTKDPGLDAVQIALPEKRGTVGEEVEFRVKAGAGAPRAGQKEAPSLSVFNPSGLKIPSQLRPGGQTDEHLGAFVPDRSGTYKVRVEGRQGAAEETVLIPNPAEEFDGAPDHARLKEVASVSGGKLVFTRDELLRETEDLGKRKESRFVEEKVRPFWANPYFLATVLAFLTMEWYLRRRWGLI
jgi:uncharacterized membrane protein